MTDHPGRPPAEQPETSAQDVRRGRLDRRRERIRAEIARNRRGGHRVPTWVLAAVLALIVLGWIVLLATR
jgi:hypothetical protein